MSKILLIDANNIAWMSYYGMPDDLSSGEIPTYLTYGFLKKTLSLAKEFETNKMIMIFDSKHNLRKKVYPGYKEKRNTSREKDPNIGEAYEQINLLRKEVLPQLGFQVEMQNGFEGDDLIWSACKSIGNKEGRQIVIVSADQDMFQCLDYHITQYSPQTKKTYTRQWFQDKYFGISPQLWYEAKAYAGCSTDEVKGLPGIGELTAMKYIAGILKKGKKFDIIENDNKETFNKNLPIVALPFEHEILKVKEVLFKKPIFYFENFFDVFEQYNIQSFLKNMKEWETSFNLQRG